MYNIHGSQHDIFGVLEKLLYFECTCIMFLKSTSLYLTGLFKLFHEL